MSPPDQAPDSHTTPHVELVETSPNYETSDFKPGGEETFAPEAFEVPQSPDNPSSVSNDNQQLLDLPVRSGAASGQSYTEDFEGQDGKSNKGSPAKELPPQELGSSTKPGQNEDRRAQEDKMDTVAKAESPPPSHSSQADYLDPTPRTPFPSLPPSRAPSNAPSPPVHTSTTEGHDALQLTFPRTTFEDDRVTPEAPTSSSHVEDESSEIQSIIDQFEEKGGGPDQDSLSPNVDETDGFSHEPVQRPPRTSSLEPLRSPSSKGQQDMPERRHSSIQQIALNSQVPSARSSVHSLSHIPRIGLTQSNDPTSPKSPMSLPNSSFPEPDPEPDLPFDFHRFLEQLRHRTADPVAKFLRSFLTEFGKKQWMVHEQVKIISDFLSFISNKMAQCEVWSEVSDAEFDNAKEGMEKLVMNRLYLQTFSPAIPPPPPLPGSKGKRKNVEKILGSGRRGQHQEDIERDEILAQKVRIYGWVQPTHLDIAPVSDSGKRFLSLAQQELLKIKSYRAPRDKVICVLNCCKVIFGLLRNSKSADTSADSFVPLLIYVVLQANPEHLVSNIQYILRFRNQDRLGGEAGYYLSSLTGAIQFIENLDRTTLTVSDEEFEKNVEAAVSAIAEGHKDEMPAFPSGSKPLLSEKSAISRPEVSTQTSSVEADHFIPRRSVENSDFSDGTDEDSAVSGLLRTIQRPLSSIGRIFSDDALERRPPSSSVEDTPRRLSPAIFKPPRNSSDLPRPPRDENPNPVSQPQRGGTGRTLSAEDAAARQASAETAEAEKRRRIEHRNVVETLAGMFPNLDKDVIDDVVRVKDGRVGLAVDACLALNS